MCPFGVTEIDKEELYGVPGRRPEFLNPRLPVPSATCVSEVKRRGLLEKTEEKRIYLKRFNLESNERKSSKVTRRTLNKKEIINWCRGRQSSEKRDVITTLHLRDQYTIRFDFIVGKKILLTY